MVLAMSRPWKHPATGIYWLRKRVPDDLRAAVGKREEKFSLKTRDPVEAKRLHAQALIEIEQRWSNLRAPISKLDNSELHRISITIYERCLELGEVPRVNWDIEIGENLWERGATDYGKFNFEKPIIPPGPGRSYIQSSTPDVSIKRFWLEQWCQDRADELISANGLNVDNEDRLKIAKAISTGAQRAAQALKRRAKGDFSQEFSAPPHSPRR